MRATSECSACRWQWESVKSENVRKEWKWLKEDVSLSPEVSDSWKPMRMTRNFKKGRDKTSRVIWEGKEENVPRWRQ